MMTADRTSGNLKGLRHTLFGYVAFLAAVVFISALIERQTLLAESQREASILHRLASQRADQHDAHLTALSALALAGSNEGRGNFLEIAATIIRFYPRIEAIDLVPVTQADHYLTTRAGLSDEVLAIIRNAARASDGQLVLMSAPDAPGRYLVVKRSPNSDDARFALSLQVDAEALLESDSPFWAQPAVSRTLAMPDGTLLAGDERIAAPNYSKALGSASQPLILEANISPTLPDLLPAGRLFVVVGLATLLYLMAMAGLRQLIRARRAESQALLSAQEARLAHASRVNALGEMASGMAHELTQPLTAILSQAQAGKHLAERGMAGKLGPVLENIAGQAKRGSAILERLRDWTRPDPQQAGPIPVNDAIRNVELLLRPEAERMGILFTTDLDSRPMPVEANQVELEQVIFNLAHNAMDAVKDGAEQRVTISSAPSGRDIVIEVVDSGPGVPADIRSRLFEPFVTRKPQGTGLGLALCHRLAERMGGELTLIDERPNTTFHLRLPHFGSSFQEAAK